MRLVGTLRRGARRCRRGDYGVDRFAYGHAVLHDPQEANGRPRKHCRNDRPLALPHDGRRRGHAGGALLGHAPTPHQQIERYLFAGEVEVFLQLALGARGVALLGHGRHDGADTGARPAAYPGRGSRRPAARNSRPWVASSRFSVSSAALARVSVAAGLGAQLGQLAFAARRSAARRQAAR